MENLHAIYIPATHLSPTVYALFTTFQQPGLGGRSNGIQDG